MVDPLIEQFRGLVRSRKVLSDYLKKLCESILSLLAEQFDLYAEIRFVDRKINDLAKEKQSPLSKRAERNLRVEIQGLKNKMESIESEAKDIDMVIKEYRNQQQEIWEKINVAWEKQCEIWDEINPSKIPNANE